MSKQKIAQVSLRIPNPPQSESELLAGLDRLVAASTRQQQAISAIGLPVDRYPNLAGAFWHIPVVDAPDGGFRVRLAGGGA